MWPVCAIPALRWWARSLSMPSERALKPALQQQSPSCRKMVHIANSLGLEFIACSKRQPTFAAPPYSFSPQQQRAGERAQVNSAWRLICMEQALAVDSCLLFPITLPLCLSVESTWEAGAVGGKAGHSQLMVGVGGSRAPASQPASCRIEWEGPPCSFEGCFC